MTDELNIGEMRKSGNSKLNEIFRRSGGDAEVSSDTPDIYFDYKDSDTYQGEMAELYSYTEQEDFQSNKQCFLNLFHQQNEEGTLWSSLSLQSKKNEVFRLVDLLEVADKEVRSNSIRALLYLLQGTFAECSQKPAMKKTGSGVEDEEEEEEEEEEKINKNAKDNTQNAQDSKDKHQLEKDGLDEHTSNVVSNTILLYNCGAFQACTQLLNMEINSNPCPNKTTISLSDNKELRFLISILYTMVETIRFELAPELTLLKDDLKSDLVTCLSSVNESSLILTLFGMVTQFCEPQPCHYPVKKVLLLLWKTLLLTLGGLDEAFATKNNKRNTVGLSVLNENPHEVCRGMRASSPPASAADLIEQHQQHRRGGRLPLRKQAASRQSSLEDGMEDMTGGSGDEEGGLNSGGLSDDDGFPPTPPRPASPQSAKALPWAPKVRKKDLELFLEQTRSKFVGFNVNDDVTSLFGLPHPIHEVVQVFNQRLYVSLSEIQMKQEEDYAKNPLSMIEADVDETPCELLYQTIYQTLPQYNIALLKILLAAAPTSKAKSDNVNVLADLLPEKMPSSVLHSMKLGIDVNRHKEVIVKAVSALLILLLKHFKINHFYQFEFMAQHLVFANCIPLVLKFLNQNILAHVCAKNNISIIDYPCCVIGDPPELNADSLEVGDNENCCWRNIFSSINLLRVLNKITKWKHSRIMMLVVFKSAPILKRALKVRHPMHQMYVLKLLKMQTKYLGRQWRKSNMKIMSAIYQKVRHRLNDDWAYGNDVDARPWDFQAEECVARSAIDQFNNRRYNSNKHLKDSSSNNNIENTATPSILNDFRPVDNCLQSVLSKNVVLSKQFEDHYQDWLECEVFSNKIDWNQFLVTSAVEN